MNKLILIFCLLSTSYFVTAQNIVRLLREGEAYNFAVGDTFQYTGSPDFRSINYNPTTFRQIVVLSKRFEQISSNERVLIYSLQIEQFIPSHLKGAISVAAKYTKSIERFVSRDTANPIGGLCAYTTKTPTSTCTDSTVLTFGTRKSYKHEFNDQNKKVSIFNLVAGLGVTVDYFKSEDSTKFKDYRMVYFNKNGEKWGTRIKELDEQKNKYKPLTYQEVYNYSIGDTFQYKNYGTPVRTCIPYLNYVQHVILEKSIIGDTIKYKIREGFKEPYQILTQSFSNLDSIVEFWAIQNSIYASVYSNPQYKESILFENGRKSVNILVGYEIGGYSRSYTENLGQTYSQIYTDTPCFPNHQDVTTELVYYANGNKKWGTPVIISSDRTPSVSQPKITVFPNPTSDILNIETDITFDKIKIINLNGQTVSSEKNTKQLSVQNLPNGIYFLHIFDKEILRGVKKIIINH